MKPAAERMDRRRQGDFSSGRRFPLVEFNYQQFSLDRFNGGFGDREPNSFFNISRDYFKREARRNFLIEAVFFLIMVAILTGMFIEGARLIIHFLQLPPG